MQFYNTSFKDNVADNNTQLSNSGKGGALYYSCLTTGMCTVEI